MIIQCTHQATFVLKMPFMNLASWSISLKTGPDEESKAAVGNISRQSNSTIKSNGNHALAHLLPT